MNTDDRRPAAASRAGGRRQEYAEATRQAIVSAARKLFAEKGYFATRVEDIAAEARVAPATVYAVGGGKYGLLDQLVAMWQSSPAIAATLDELLRLDDPVLVLRVLSARTRQIREEYSDIIKTVLATAPNDQAVAATLDKVVGYYRGSINRVSQHLADLNALQPRADVQFATAVLWFYFGFPGLSAMHDDSGWSYDDAEKWLADEAIRALLPGAE
jgi:AcrR family transcriptional regulator